MAFRRKLYRTIEELQVDLDAWSLLMVYQALGSFDVGPHLDWVQLTTFLIFLSFYIPCVSTFAVMLKPIGRRQALLSIALSVTVALGVAGAVRVLLEFEGYLL